jgi:hypothetical protein
VRPSAPKLALSANAFSRDRVLESKMSPVRWWYKDFAGPEPPKLSVTCKDERDGTYVMTVVRME